MRQIPPGWQEVFRRTFEHKGVQVTEILCKRAHVPAIRMDGANCKILWCLTPFEDEEVNGVKNFVVHTTVGEYDETQIARARIWVETKFNEHYNLS